MHVHNSSSMNAIPAQRGSPQRRWPEPLRITLWLFLGIAAFYLVIEHREHVLAGVPWLPYLLLAACPLMHLFGHGRHGHHHHEDAPGSAPLRDDATKGSSNTPK